MNRRLALAIVAAMAAAATGIAVFTRLTSSSHEASAEPVRAIAFDSVFAKVRELVMEEPDTAPISVILHFRPVAGDRFLVVDRDQNRVRIHSGSGSLIRIIGRRGEGPGEFKTPVAGFVDGKGDLYVTEGSPRVTRFKQDLAFDTVIRVPADAVHQIEPLDSILVLGIYVGRDVEKYLLLSKNGDLLGRFHRSPPLHWEVPYWSSFIQEDLAVASDRIFVSDGFLYPLSLYDTEGRFIRTLGTPPGSWAEASRPMAGAFTGPGGMERMQDWLRSFTMIRQIDVYRDSLLVVTHARYVPDVRDLGRTEDIGLDLYNLGGDKLYEDIDVPGRVLRAEDYLYLLLAEPPEGWIIGIYEYRGDRSVVE
jgi:hypothetical protein